MAKQGIYYTKTDAFLRSLSKTTGWALCVGAGTSTPAFPSWPELIRKLVSLDKNASSGLADILLSKFSPDSIIQASKNILGLDDDSFSAVLSEQLYNNLKAKIDHKVWPIIIKGLECDIIGHLNKDEWTTFIDSFEKDSILSKISALGLADIISDVVGTELSPNAILSFNAEPLLFALTNAYIVFGR